MLPTEILFDIFCFLDRHDIDALQLVNAALDSVLTAHFEDHPLRPLKVTVSGYRVYLEGQPSEANKAREAIFCGDSLKRERAAHYLKQ